MRFSSDHGDHGDAVVALFTASFAASEGPEEGRVIGALVRDILGTTPPDDLLVHLAWRQHRLVGAIVFTRLRFAREARTVFLLSPVAVRPEAQRQGVAQALLCHGLDDLRARGVDVVVTYGDPDYYARVGFAPVPQTVLAPPKPLSQPQGWLAQALTGARVTPFRGVPQAVSAFDDPAYW